MSDLRRKVPVKQHREQKEELDRLREEVAILRSETNNRDVWVKRKLEKEREQVCKIQKMKVEVEQRSELMVGKYGELEEEAARVNVRIKEMEEELCKAGARIPETDKRWKATGDKGRNNQEKERKRKEEWERRQREGERVHKFRNGEKL